MTAAALRAELAVLLADHLGSYTTPQGDTVPAIYVGDPPADWQATGLEVRIEPMPDYALERVHTGAAFWRDFQVRLVPRSGSAQAALEAILKRYETTDPLAIPANEGLGILKQFTLKIRS